MCSASCSVLQAYGPSTTTQRYPCAARTPRLSARAAEDSARLTAVKKKIPTMLVIAIFKIGKTAVAAAPGRLRSTQCAGLTGRPDGGVGFPRNSGSDGFII